MRRAWQRCGCHPRPLRSGAVRWLLLLLVGRSLVVELPGGECGVVAGGSGAKAAVEALALALRKEVALLGRERECASLKWPHLEA